MKLSIFVKNLAIMIQDSLQIPLKINKVDSSKIGEVDFSNIPFGKVFSDHMLELTYDNGRWLSAEIKGFANLSLSPANSALHYGQSIFEGLKAYKNKDGEVSIFRPDENIKRLNQSAKRMAMPTIDEAFLLEAIRKLIKIDEAWVPDVDGASLYIRPFLFATDEYVGIRPSESYKLIVFTCPVGTYYSEPVRVKIEREFTRAAKGGVGYAKTAGNYAASLYPARLAQKEGYHQLLWTDGISHEYIEESGTMNVMFKIGDKIITPKSSDSILSGITRRSVVAILKDWGLDVEERDVKVSEVVDALKDGTLNEAFGIGTAATIARIKTIGDAGHDYDLPEAKEDDLAVKIMNYMNEYKLGLVPDKFNWLTKV